jgi:hypothetical protein
MLFIHVPFFFFLGHSLVTHSQRARERASCTDAELTRFSNNDNNTTDRPTRSAVPRGDFSSGARPRAGRAAQDFCPLRSTSQPCVVTEWL